MAMAPERPYTLIAELTYRCALRCLYCSNPVAYAQATELPTHVWRTALREAEALGVVQANLTGGEPLLREDLEELIAEANALHLYTNLITSGMPLERRRLETIRDCGLNSVQLSLQGLSTQESNRIAGGGTFGQKHAVAVWIKDLGLPLTLNVVLHRNNIEDVANVIELAECLQADRLELANTQYLGWAFLNRQALLPTRQQVDHARQVAHAAKARLTGRMEVLFVTPDYYSDFPRSCMDGWGRRYIIIAPDGQTLPCHAAGSLPGMHFDTIAGRPLREIWQDSDAFQQFRGEGWMPLPCRSCDRRSIDFGGCRCQAFHLAGDPTATDPACRFSPHHALIQAARIEAEKKDAPIPLHYRKLMIRR
jgi:PqqA peptide cyclase